MKELLSSAISHTESVKDVFTIIFSLVATVIAVLTYLHARKSLFQPVRTEVIKKQTELLTQLLEALFKRPIEESADYVKLVSMNVFALMDVCGLITHNHEENKKSFAQFYGGERLFAHNGVLEEYELVETFKDKEISDAEIRELKKKKHEQFKAGTLKVSAIKMSQEHMAFVAELNSYVENPFLPKQIGLILAKLLYEINYNIEIVMKKCLEDFLTNLRQQHEQRGLISLVDSLGEYNNFNHQRLDHRPTCTHLRSAIRKYLRIDEKW